MTATGDKVNDLSDDALLELLHGIAHRVRASMHEAIVDDESGLSGMEARALRFVERHPDSTPGEMVKHSGRDKGQVARLLNGLVDGGFLVRADGPDRRTHSLRTTAEGKAVNRRLERKRQDVAGIMFRGFSGAERKVLAGFLQRMLDTPA